MLNPIDALKHIPEEIKTLIANAKLEAKVEALQLVAAAEQAGAEAAHQFLEDRIAELKSQIKPL